MRVLIVDDDELMRVQLEMLMRARGHDVCSAPSATGALEEFVRDRPTLVVVDGELNGMGGGELCRRFRAADPRREAFLLVFTARDSEAELIALLDAGADDLVARPVVAHHLEARMVIVERRVAADAARRRAEEALARAQWLAGIGETTIAVQHEINNPLTALLGAAALMAEGATPEEQHEHVAAIVEQAQRIADVVRRLGSLEDPRTVEYLDGVRMLDLSKD